MSYVTVIPSMTEYSARFKELSALDLKIIKTMCRLDVRNISKLAKKMGVPQQTLSYRVKRFDKLDLVRFRAVVNERMLGLKSYLVLATSPLGKEGSSSRALTCFPLWRYLAIVDGWKHGSYVRYAIPPDKEKDLEGFLDELVKRELITDYEMFPVTGPNYPLLNLDFYIEKKAGIPIFNWKKWITDYESFREEKISEFADFKKAKFDLYDLIILRCLEINARMKLRKVAREMAQLLGEEQHKRFIPLVSRRLKQNIIPQGLIKSYRVYLFPNPANNMIFLIYYINFANSSSLRKFIYGLSLLPYNTAYQKVLGKDELFVHFAIPTYEYSNMRKMLFELGEMGYLKNANILLGDLERATWDNVALYQMFKDGAWNFSYGIAVKMLEKVFR
jgi:DNA-binding Lrp family transcriptional regulator